MPEFPAPDGPVVMHDDFAQVAEDTLGSYRAVCVLMDLLNGDSPEDLDPEDRAGLSVLLEGTRYRLELAVEGLRAIGKTLQIPSVLEERADEWKPTANLREVFHPRLSPDVRESIKGYSDRVCTDVTDFQRALSSLQQMLQAMPADEKVEPSDLLAMLNPLMAHMEACRCGAATLDSMVNRENWT